MSERVYSEEYYEHIAKIFGQEIADWSRLPAAERWAEVERLQAMFDTPNDRSIWPPELGGDPDVPLLPKAPRQPDG